MPRRGECIYKRKDGRWEARYVKAIGVDGRKKYGSVYAGSYHEVKDKRQDLMRVPLCKPKQTGDLKVADLMERWLQHMRGQVRRSSYCKYERMVVNHILPALGGIPLTQLTRRGLEEFAQEHRTTGRVGGGGLSLRTVNDILVILLRAFDFAQQEYGVTLPRVHLLREEKRDARVLSVAEQERLVGYLLQDMDLVKFAVLLTLYTGLRVGELCALQWGDIRGDCIHITKTMQRLPRQGGQSAVVIGPPKSASSNRIIPLPTILAPYLERFRGAEDTAVVHTTRRPYAEPRNMQLWFKRIAADCALEGATVHTLRHTFATRCIEAGFDPKTLSEILGHADVKTTMNRYVHPSFALKRSNMEKLALPGVS